MPCCGMKAHWIVGTITNILGLMMFVFGFVIPFFIHLNEEAAFGIWSIYYEPDINGTHIYNDIADTPFYGMSSTFWRPAQGIGSAGIALSVYGSVLFQIFQFGNVNTMLPVPVCIVLAGSILTTASIVVFQHNSEIYEADHMVTNGISLFFCVIGTFFLLVSGFELMVSTMKKIKKSRKLNGK